MRLRPTSIERHDDGTATVVWSNGAVRHVQPDALARIEAREALFTGAYLNCKPKEAA